MPRMNKGQLAMMGMQGKIRINTIGVDEGNYMT